MDHLTEQDAGLLEQAASMLEGLANDERNRGNCSSSEGAACSAHAIRRLAPAMLCRAGNTHPVLDDRWKARILDGRAIERDEMGLGDHPELPWLDEGMMPRSFYAALGLELAHTMAEDQLDGDALEAMSEAVNWTAWQPTAPQGDGWKLVSIFDTEDGPAAWWLRELPEAEDGTTTIRNLKAEVEKLEARIARLYRAGAAPAAVSPQGEYPPLPKVGPIGYASVVDVESHTQALRAIADWPVTDMLMNMDAANMRGIAQRALAAAPQAPAAPVDDLAQLVKQLVRALRKALPGNDLADKALDYLKRQGLQGSPLRATPEAPQTHAGLLAAAAHIQAKAQAHLDERGSYDPDTGAVEMSESNQEHFNTLDELAEELRELADKSAQAACDKPPAGWTCSRAPGHDGPCAAAPAAPAGDASDPALPSWWPDFIQCVAELPDRNSPEDEPDAMIATAEELGACAIAAQAAAKGSAS